MSDKDQKAIALSDQMQLQMSGQGTDIVAAAICVLMADIAINVSDTQSVGEKLIDNIGANAKAKMNLDWAEGKERLSAFSQMELNAKQ